MYHRWQGQRQSDFWGGYGGDGTGSSVLGNVTSPYFTVKNMLVWSMYRFVAGTYRFIGWWYRFL